MPQQSVQSWPGSSSTGSFRTCMPQRSKTGRLLQSSHPFGGTALLAGGSLVHPLCIPCTYGPITLTFRSGVLAKCRQYPGRKSASLYRDAATSPSVPLSAAGDGETPVRRRFRVGHAGDASMAGVRFDRLASVAVASGSACPRNRRLSGSGGALV